MRILFISDAWLPQVNGVVRTLQTTRDELIAMGHEAQVIGPEHFVTMPLPTYSEIRLALLPGVKLGNMIDDIKPDAIHIATEGPLGWAAREYCLNREIQFTTSYHTRFPEYIRKRVPIPLAWTYRMLRMFHAPASAVMVATPSVERALRRRGFTHLERWERGVDTRQFHPLPPDQRDFLDLPRPILVYVGRLAVEKNVKAFLQLKTPGTKLVVGDGPQAAGLMEKFPEAHFVGAKHGEELARYYGVGDVFVFPSLTDTFGLVVLEALACGVPVAAYPVTGPLDILGADGSGVGVLDEDLEKAVEGALALDPSACRAFAETRSWRRAAEQFLGHLDPFERERLQRRVDEEEEALLAQSVRQDGPA